MRLIVSKARSLSSVALMGVAFVLTLSSSLAAGPISINVIGTSGGNPGGMDVYEVSGLMEGGGLNLVWFHGVTNADEDEFELSATGMLSVDILTATRLKLGIMLTNTSTVGAGIRLTSFGLGVDGFTILNDTSTGGILLPLADDSQFPGFNDVDVCATIEQGQGREENCSGGPGGIGVNASNTFMLDLAGNFGSTVTLSQFALKIQTDIQEVADNSYELPGVPSPKVPEPSSAILLGLGLAGLGFFSKRRKRRLPSN